MVQTTAAQKNHIEGERPPRQASEDVADIVVQAHVVLEDRHRLRPAFHQVAHDLTMRQPTCERGRRGRPTPHTPTFPVVSQCELVSRQALAVYGVVNLVTQTDSRELSCNAIAASGRSFQAYDDLTHHACQASSSS